MLAGRRVARRPSEAHLNGGNFLAGQETDDIELVHHGIVDEHLVGEPGRGVRVTVRAVQHQGIAQLLPTHHLAQARVFRVEAAHEPDLHALVAEALLGFHDLPRRCGIRGQRLLAEDREIEGEGLEQDVFVQEAGGGDQHGVDVVTGECLLGAGQGHCRGDSFDGRLGASQVYVDDGGNLSSGNAAVQTLNVVSAHASRTDDGNAQILRHGIPF